MSTESRGGPRQEIGKLFEEIVLKEPSLSLERSRFNTEAAYAFNRGISLLGINTLRRLKEWGSDGRATAGSFKTIDGETAVVYKTTSKAPYHFRAVIIPNSEGVASRITIEKTTGRGKNKKREHFEIKLGGSPSYRQATEYTGVNDEKVTEIWEYQYSSYTTKRVSGSYRQEFRLNQQQRGKTPFKFGQIAINYTQKGANSLEAGDLQISFGNELEPIQDAFLDLVKPHALKSAASLVREAVGKKEPRVFGGVQVLSKTGIAETTTFRYDAKVGAFCASERPRHSYQGDYIIVGPEREGLSVPAKIEDNEDLVIRPSEAFIVEDIERLSGSRTFVKTRLKAPNRISADSETKNYIVPRRVIGE